MTLNTRHYDRGGVDVVVQTHLQGRDAEHCLCCGCAWFRPGTVQNCHIAAAVSQLNTAFAVVTPVWECPQYQPANS